MRKGTDERGKRERERARRHDDCGSAAKSTPNAERRTQKNRAVDYVRNEEWRPKTEGRLRRR